ncbi:MAG: purple acid phosphatase family protein [Promethearchaeota archaeon]
MISPRVAPTRASGTSNPSGVRLTVVNDPATSIVVAWKDEVFVDGAAVQFGPTPGLGRSQPAASDEIETGYYYSAELTDLTPDTEYYFRVGSGQAWSEVYNTHTAPVPGEKGREIRFLAWGDSRSDHATRGNLSVAAHQKVLETGGVDFTIHSGDIVSSGTVQAQWDDYFNETVAVNGYWPCYYVAGNHEYDSAENTLMYENLELPSNGLNSWYYAASYGTITVLGLDTNPHLQKGFYEDMNSKWLDAAIKNANNRKNTLWVIATFHEPLYSSQRGRPDREDLKLSWGSKFDGNVDLVVVGHNHYYARTYPVDSKGNFDDSSVSRYDNPGKWVQVISGGAGAPLYGSKFQNHPTVAKFNGTYHFMLGSIAFNDTHTWMQVKTWEMWKTRPLDASNQFWEYSDLNLLDEFTIVKPLPEKFTNPSYMEPNPIRYQRPGAATYLTVYVLITVGVGGVAAYVLWTYWQNRQNRRGVNKMSEARS